MCLCVFFCFQAEDGIRVAQESRGLGDVYKRQLLGGVTLPLRPKQLLLQSISHRHPDRRYSAVLQPGPDAQVLLHALFGACLLYTSDAADDLLCVDIGGRRILTKKKKNNNYITASNNTPTT